MRKFRVGRVVSDIEVFQNREGGVRYSGSPEMGRVVSDIEIVKRSESLVRH